jgi:hypothetical protein
MRMGPASRPGHRLLGWKTIVTSRLPTYIEDLKKCSGQRDPVAQSRIERAGEE